jgi:midasin (ATPase involved in ribosome maturation)
VGYQQLAEDGFAVLGERLRGGDERAVVGEVLQKVLGAKVRRWEVGEVGKDGLQGDEHCMRVRRWRAGWRGLQGIERDCTE